MLYEFSVHWSKTSEPTNRENVKKNQTRLQDFGLEQSWLIAGQYFKIKRQEKG